MKGRILLTFALIVVASCAAPLTTARKSVSAAATLGNAAGQLVISIDAEKEGAIAMQLAKDHNIGSAEAARDAWRSTRQHINQAIKTYDAVVVAAGATAELAGSKSVDLNALLTSLTSAYLSLKGALASYGVSLPGGL